MSDVTPTPDGIIYSKQIPQHERNVIDFLQALEAPSNNLFFASFISSSFTDIPYRIAGIKVESPSISYDLNGNKQPIIKSADYNNEVSITWVEDVYRSVEKFHIDWLNNWYDFNSDCLPIGTNGRFRSIELIGYHYKNIVKDGSTIPIMESEPTIWLSIYNLMPQKFSDNGFNFKWGESSEHTITISYKYTEIRPFYYNRQAGQYILSENELMNNSTNPGFGGARSSAEECNDKPINKKNYCTGGSTKHWYSDKQKPFSAWSWHETDSKQRSIQNEYLANANSDRNDVAVNTGESNTAASERTEDGKDK